MARILWHGIPPWHKTGYGVQTRIFVPRLASLGHELVIAQMGRRGTDDNPLKCHPEASGTIRTGYWEGIRVIGPGLTEFGLPPPADVRDAFGGHDPDLVIVLKDPWVLSAADYEPYNTAVWTNIDCDPLGMPDHLFFEASGARPVAVSRFGLAKLREAGFKNALYVPHGVDMADWQPVPREEARASLGLPQDVEIWGINAVNVDWRKAWGEQFTAFAEQRHRFAPGALLLAHTRKTPRHYKDPDGTEHVEGISLDVLADELAISDAVLFPGGDGYVPTGHMRDWYGSLTGLLHCTYGEGFGVPVCEALAMGIPVIGQDCSAITEKIPPGAGRLVRGQKWWHPHFAAWWQAPRIPEIVAAMGRLPEQVPDDIRCRYDADMITTEYWKPILDKLLAR